MNKKVKILPSILLGLTLVITGCNATTQAKSSEQKQEQTVKETKKENKLTAGQELSNILSSTNWQDTKVYDKDNNDLTKENANFIGLEKYDDETSKYEFFDKTTKESRGDKGTFFITNDGKIRVLISESMGYQADVEITELNKDMFTYKRMGKDAKGNDVEVFVDHIPYKETELSFTDPDKTLKTYTGEVVTNIDGDKILSGTLWQGTVALDETGNDVSSYNSLGMKYGAVLELTELNENKFTYKRNGKDKDGKDIIITVEHIPYDGDFKLEFSK